MKWNDALVRATIPAYAGCIYLTATGKPPIANMDPALQVATYVTMGSLLALTQAYPSVKWLRMGVGLLYGFAAMLAFSGGVEWAYNNVAEPVQGAAMAAWDVALGVALLKE